MSFLTVHILTALPMHNLNRGADGLPKSQFDGGVQRARLSSQALKRPARVAFREATALGSVRTKNAAALILGLAEKWAAEKELALDVKAAQADIKKVLTALAKADKKRSDASGDTEDAEEAKDNILLFAQTELETLARAVVEKQQSTEAVTLDDFILDFRSPALDIAAFGRMFANRADRSTHAAVAVSHAVTTHPMALTVDYFTAVDDAPVEGRTDAGASFLSLAYFTSGVYYRTFTIDPVQLRRSWSRFDSPTARTEVATLVACLIKALPTGRITNSNAHTLPFLVLLEEQTTRTAYEFETPVENDDEGGYKRPSVRRLADQRRAALAFDPTSFVDAAYAGETYGADLAATQLDSLDSLADCVAEKVFVQ